MPTRADGTGSGVESSLASRMQVVHKDQIDN